VANSDRARHVQQLIQVLDSVDLWLRRHVIGRTMPLQAAKLALALRRYLVRCRNKIRHGDFSDRDLIRWRRKIDEAMHALLRELSK
jgi:hypothetical protein